jgi:hypothetical protein
VKYEFRIAYQGLEKKLHQAQAKLKKASKVHDEVDTFLEKSSNTWQDVTECYQQVADAYNSTSVTSPLPLPPPLLCDNEFRKHREPASLCQR